MKLLNGRNIILLSPILLYFEGITIGIQAKFVRMIATDAAVFRIDEGIEIVGEAVEPAQMVGAERVVLAFRSKGNSTVPQLGGRLLTHGDILDMMVIPSELEISLGLPGDNIR